MTRWLVAAVFLVAACATPGPSAPPLGPLAGRSLPPEPARFSAPSDHTATPAPSGCSSDGWCWRNPLPRGNDWLTVAGAGRSVLVAGVDGTLLRFDGRSWSDDSPPTRDTIIGAWQGDGGTFAITRSALWRRDAAGWATLAFDLHAPRALWGAGAALFVVDREGVARFDGTSIQRDRLSMVPRAIGGTTPERVFVVGDGGRIARWDGQSWSDWAGPSSGALDHVWVGAAIVIASGEDGTFVHDGDKWHRGFRERALGCWGRARVIRCLRDDGHTWFLERGVWQPHGAARIDAPVRALFSADQHGAVAVGDGGAIHRFDDGNWQELSHGDRRALRAVWGRATDAEPDVWAVGDGGVVLRRRYDRFVVALDLATMRAFRSVWGSERGDVWAVGDDGLMVHHDGQRFHTMDVTRRDLHAVRGRAHDDVWAVGDQVALHWDGARWREVAGPAARLSALTTSVEPAFFGLYDGTFARRGEGWSAIDAAPVRAACTLSQHILTVGQRARRYDGSAWHDEHEPSRRLDDVSCLGDAEAWAVGEVGSVLRRAGDGRWHTSDTGTTRALHGVWAGEREVFAVGDGGTILSRVR